MLRELLLAGLIMAVGLAIAGVGTYLYQWVSKSQAVLRYDGKTLAHSLGNLGLSFVCGPMIMGGFYPARGLGSIHAPNLRVRSRYRAIQVRSAD